jgi:ABC-type methionine transport system ATPase subunit
MAIEHGGAGGLNPTETPTLLDLIQRLRDELDLTIMVVEPPPIFWCLLDT